MIDNILNRVELRLADDDGFSQNVVEELCRYVIDRLCIRLGVTEYTFPSIFNSIAVDATVKAFRRIYFEGISTENTAGLSVSFFDDILSEYNDEISRYVKSNGTYGKKGVKFL